MTLARRIVLAVATLALALLLWRLDAGRIWGHLQKVGWGLSLILAQEIVAHLFNAWGWRFAFSPAGAARHGMGELLRLRVAGDGVNYLTPSATIAGEFMRAVMLKTETPAEVRYASVAVAKFTQALAQALFILTGLVVLVASGHPALERHPSLWRAAACALALLLAGLGLYGILSWRRRRASSTLPRPNAPLDRATWSSALGAVPRQCLNSLLLHPGRFAASTSLFFLGYAWGAFEAYWICRFLEVPVPVGTAFAIEALSQLVDGMFFMVPAKVGTQEAGKTAVFLALGLEPAAGFAFGVIRHLRELSWAAAGLALCRGRRRPEPVPEPAAA